MRAVLFFAVLAIAIAVLLRELFSEGRRRLRREKVEAAVKAREANAAAEPGGSPELPILVPTASVVETEAEMRRCPRCEGALHVTEHVAQTVGDERLRVVRLRCARCAAIRELYFRIGLLS